jgi:hypothetical protein
MVAAVCSLESRCQRSPDGSGEEKENNLCRLVLSRLLQFLSRTIFVQLWRRIQLAKRSKALVVGMIRL